MRKIKRLIVGLFTIGFLSGYFFAYYTVRFPSMQNEVFILDEDVNKVLNYNHYNFKSCLDGISAFSEVNIQWHNKFWQKLWTPLMTVYLYKSYFDNRSSNEGLGVIRILVLIRSLDPKPLYCQIWFNSWDKPLIIKGTLQILWQYPGWDVNYFGYSPYLLSCPLYKTNSVPKKVTINNDPCKSGSNILNVIYDVPEERKDFAVCVKGLHFPRENISPRLVEWIELQRVLGAQKIYFYVFKVHPSTNKVLKYYKDKDIIDITHVTMATDSYFSSLNEGRVSANDILQKRQEEMIVLNDCLYRNINRFKYIIICDIDELIVPVKHNTWIEMIEHLQNILKPKETKYAGFEIRHAYFMPQFSKHGHDSIPKNMFFLQHTVRSSNFSEIGEAVKSIVDTQGTVIVHNHTPLVTFCGYNRFYSVEPELAQLQHYRDSCLPFISFDICHNVYMKYLINDTLIWRYKELLIREISNNLKDIEML